MVIRYIPVVMALLLAGSAWAEPAPEAVTRKIQAMLPGTRMASVETTPLEGVYEVAAGQNIFYMQPDKPYLLVGHLFNLQTTEDMTQPKKDKLQAASFKLDWQGIPPVARITAGDGQAKREVVAFLDVDCPYCKQAYQRLKAAQGIKVHYVMLPLDGLHPEAREKTINILCAADPAAALDSGMVGLPTPQAQTDCRTKAEGELAEVAQYAAAHNIQGTPFFVTNDGLVVPGMGDNLSKWIQEKK